MIIIIVMINISPWFKIVTTSSLSSSDAQVNVSFPFHACCSGGEIRDVEMNLIISVWGKKKIFVRLLTKTLALDNLTILFLIISVTIVPPLHLNCTTENKPDLKNNPKMFWGRKFSLWPHAVRWQGWLPSHNQASPRTLFTVYCYTIWLFFIGGGGVASWASSHLYSLYSLTEVGI